MVDPKTMLGVVDNQALARIAEEANERLRRALEAL
jgi:adenosine/AMP kinase